MSASVAAFIDRLASERYGSDWNRRTGMRCSSHKPLRPGMPPLRGPLRSDPDVLFFEAANPGHREGDMLVCVAPLTATHPLRAIGRAPGLLSPAAGRTMFEP